MATKPNNISNNSKLTAKQQRFVSEYLVDSNGTQAAIRAGYSTKRASEIAYTLMQKPHVRTAVEVARAQQAKRLEITADRVLAELGKVAFSDMRKIADWDKSGVRFKDSASLSDDIGPAVSEISETTTQFGGTKRIKLHDKVKALDILAKHFGMLDGKRDVIEDPGVDYIEALKGTAAEVWDGEEAESEEDE